MLALVASAPDPVISVPADLDDVDALLDLRARLEGEVGALARSTSPATDGAVVVLDCRILEVVSTPALGWLAETITRASRRGVQVDVVHLAPGLTARLMQLMHAR